jgi:RNA recognition motif-containing protein
VFNVPQAWDEQTLAQRFSAFGTVTAVTAMRDAGPGGGHNGCGFVSFSQVAEAQTAVNAMNGYHVDGQRLRVAPSRY